MIGQGHAVRAADNGPGFWVMGQISRINLSIVADSAIRPLGVTALTFVCRCVAKTRMTQNQRFEWEK